MISDLHKIGGKRLRFQGFFEIICHVSEESCRQQILDAALNIYRNERSGIIYTYSVLQEKMRIL